MPLIVEMLRELCTGKIDYWDTNRMAGLEYDFAGATEYHYGRFPPPSLDLARLIAGVGSASAAIARYDAVLRGLQNSDLLLAPLRRREAVISSRIEGTIATMDEVLKFEAGSEDEDSAYRHDVVEVFSYGRAMNHAQKLMAEGLPLSGRLIREAHSKLLFFGRGADKEPGHFKRDQNYVVDKARKRILFIPASPERFGDLFHEYEKYINRDDVEPLLQTALAHLEFEALHPFKDGNGRIGRMLITLMLWNRRLISSPQFYISGQLEIHKNEYIDRMRNVSAHGEWTEWCVFFLQALEDQALENLQVAESIRTLYEEMKERFRAATSSQWAITALDYIFNKPVFRNSSFTSDSGIPRQTAHRMTSQLSDAGILAMVEPAAGRRSATYALEPLLELVRA